MLSSLATPGRWRVATDSQFLRPRNVQSDDDSARYEWYYMSDVCIDVVHGFWE